MVGDNAHDLYGPERLCPDTGRLHIIFVDLDYKLLKCWHQKKGLSPLKHVMNPKRDIVDPLFHASRMFGRDPTLGLAFSYIWEMGVEGLVNETLNDLMDLNADHARAGVLAGLLFGPVSGLLSSVSLYGRFTSFDCAQDATRNVLGMEGSFHCGGFSLGSSVGREGPLIEGPFIRWRGLRESLCGLRGGFWGEVGRKVAKPFRKILLVE